MYLCMNFLRQSFRQVVCDKQAYMRHCATQPHMVGVSQLSHDTQTRSERGTKYITSLSIIKQLAVRRHRVHLPPAAPTHNSPISHYYHYTASSHYLPCALETIPRRKSYFLETSRQFVMKFSTVILKACAHYAKKFRKITSTQHSYKQSTLVAMQFCISEAYTNSFISNYMARSGSITTAMPINEPYPSIHHVTDTS